MNGRRSRGAQRGVGQKRTKNAANSKASKTGYGTKFSGDNGLTMEQQWSQFCKGADFDSRYNQYEREWKARERAYQANPELAAAKAAYMAESHRYTQDEVAEALIGARPTRPTTPVW